MLLHRISRYIRKYNLLNAGDTVIVGNSGGPDSTALLHLLHSVNLDLKLIAVYVNHNLRPEEVMAEQRFIEQLAKSLNVINRTISVDVTGYQRDHKCSLEEAARKLRYTALEKERINHNAAAIAVGHNSDDQVEEFLIRMIRGSGLKGLSGISRKNGRIVRPLLEETKASLLKYLHDANLEFCHDSSNDDVSLLRNRVRHHLLPELENHFNPAIRTTLLQTTSILAEDEALLDHLATTSYENLCENSNKSKEKTRESVITVKLLPFLKEHEAVQRRVLEKMIWEMEIKPSYRTITQLQSLVATGTNNSLLHLPEGLRAHISNGVLSFSFPSGRKSLRGDKPIAEIQELEISETGTFTVSGISKKITITKEQTSTLDIRDNKKLFLDAAKVSFPLQLRAAQKGEKVQLLGSPGRKKIARILSDRKVPTSNRPHHPLLVADDEILCILGIQIADQFKIEPHSPETLVILWEDLEEN